MVLSEGIVRFWKGWCGNPSGSRPNFFGRQHLTFDKGGKDIVRSEGIVRFWKGWCGWGGSMRREGQAHSPTKSGCDSADVKAYRRIQMLALQKARVVVRGEGWMWF